MLKDTYLCFCLVCIFYDVFIIEREAGSKMLMVICVDFSVMQDRREQARQDLKGLEETVVSYMLRMFISNS